MGKILEIKIDNFSKEMTDSVRNENHNGFAFAYNFDIPEPSRLVARRSFTAITASNEQIYRFLYTKFKSGATVVYRLYGMGKSVSTADPILYQRELTAAGWTAVTGGEFATGDIEPRVFFYYKNYVYLFQAVNGTTSAVLSRFGDLTGTPSKTEDAVVTDFSGSDIGVVTNVAQPVHHPADDIAYFFMDNKVHKLNNTAWTANALTLPDNLKIVGAAPYGDFLAILCSPIESGTTESFLYLWDRDSSLTTISAKINLGVGDAYHIGSDDNGVFIAMIRKSIADLGEYNTKLVIKYYRGFLIEKEFSSASAAGYFKDILLNGASANQYLNSIMVGSGFYFPATLSTSKDSVKYDVIFKAKMVNGEVILSANTNYPSIAAGQSLNGIFELTGYFFVSYGSTPLTAYNAISSVFSSAAMESMIYSVGDPSNKKDLIGVTVFTEPLIAGASYTLKYRKNAETSWTTIFTESTDDSVSHSSVNIESTGAILGQFKQIQFRVESEGGANITGFSFKVDILSTKPY